MSTRFIFITGGVVSSLGKGLGSAALGALLQARDIPAKVPRARVARLFDAQAMVTKFERLYHAARAQRDVALPRKTYPAIALQVEGAPQPLAEAG